MQLPAALPLFFSCAFCAFLWLTLYSPLWLYYSRQGGLHGKQFEVYDHLSLLRGNDDD